MVSEEEVEMAARAIAEAWGETWECCCNERRGLDCDCGDAMNDEREAYDERLSREDCRMAARAALSAAARVRAEDNAGEPVADEKLPCDVQLPGVKLERGVRLSTLLMAIRKRKDWPEEQTKLPRMPVAAHPAPQPSGPVEVKPLEWWAASTGDIIADSIVGRYRLGKVTANENYRLDTPGGLVEKDPPYYYWPEQEAKAAAQADFESRILSALTAGKPEQEQSEPVAHAYVIDGECEQIEWGTEIGLPDDPSLVLLYAAPTAGGGDA